MSSREDWAAQPAKRVTVLSTGQVDLSLALSARATAAGRDDDDDSEAALRARRARGRPSAEAESLVRALLTIDSAARLGAPGAGGAAAVRAHAWFAKRFGRVDDAAAGAEEEGGWADLLAKASSPCVERGTRMMLVSVSQKA